MTTKKIAAFVFAALLAVFAAAQVSTVATRTGIPSGIDAATMTALTAGSALTGTEEIPAVQGGATVKTTPAAIHTYVQGAASTWTGTQTFSVSTRAANGSKTAPSYTFANSTGDGWYWRSGINIGLAGAGKEILQVSSNGNLAVAGSTISAKSSGGGDLSAAGNDTVWAAKAAGIWEQRGDSGVVTGIATIIGGPQTVAQLPTCGASLAGGRAFVTDANSATFNAAAVGGGSNKVPVFCTGAAWLIG